MKSNEFQYIIIGGGIIGCCLVLKLLNDKKISPSSILLVDSQKKLGGRYFSFVGSEIKNGDYDEDLIGPGFEILESHELKKIKDMLMSLLSEEEKKIIKLKSEKNRSLHIYEDKRLLPIKSLHDLDKSILSQEDSLCLKTILENKDNSSIKKIIKSKSFKNLKNLPKLLELLFGSLDYNMSCHTLKSKIDEFFSYISSPVDPIFFNNFDLMDKIEGILLQRGIQILKDTQIRKINLEGGDKIQIKSFQKQRQYQININTINLFMATPLINAFNILPIEAFEKKALQKISKFSPLSLISLEFESRPEEISKLFQKDIKIGDRILLLKDSIQCQILSANKVLFFRLFNYTDLSHTKLTAAVVKSLKKGGLKFLSNKNNDLNKEAALGKIIITPIFYENRMLSEDKSENSPEINHKNLKLINSLDKLLALKL